MTTTQLKIQNNYSWLLTDEKDVKQVLWKALRFRAKDYFHSRLYQQRLWDGFDEFFKMESGRFLTGLLPEVEAALDFLECPYTIHDERDPFEFDIKKITDQFLEKQRDSNIFPDPFILRDYQVDFTNQLVKYQRGVLQAPTSAGKSAVIVCLLKCIPDNIPTVFTSKSVDLVRQVYEDMEKWNVKGAGKIFGSAKKNFAPNMKTAVNIASIHKLDKVLPKVKALIVDEGHLMMSKKPIEAYRKMKNATFRVSVSATPFKFGGTDKSQKYKLKGWFGPMLRTKTVEGGVLTTEILQEKGILAPSKCTFYPIKEPDLPYEIYQDAVTRGISENFHFHDIVKRLVEKKCKGRTLIMVDRINHGDILSQMIPGAVWVQGKDNIDTRKHVIEQLKTEENVVAIAMQQIFNAGINFFIHNLVNAAGGQAEHQIIQRIGRGLRTAGDKDMLHYYDFVFHINDYLLKHSKARIKILEKKKHDVTVMDRLDF